MQLRHGQRGLPPNTFVFRVDAWNEHFEVVLVCEQAIKRAIEPILVKLLIAKLQQIAKRRAALGSVSVRTANSSLTAGRGEIATCVSRRA